MRLRNTTDTYGTIAKFLHWAIALLVVLMLIGGVLFNYMPKGDFRSFLVQMHKSTGVTILILMVLRLLWRWINPYPTLPSAMNLPEKMSARAVHLLFYILLIAMPLTGMIMTMAAGYPVPFWGITTLHWSFIPAQKSLSHLMFNWHSYLAWTIGILIALHTIAALKHHFIDKDNVLKRMWRQ